MNIIKGYFSTILGIALIGLAISSVLGYTHVESSPIDRKYYLIIMFGVGVLFVFMPATFIEETVKKIVNKYFDGKNN